MSQRLPKAARRHGVGCRVVEPTPYRRPRGMPQPHALRGGARRSGRRGQSSVRARLVIFGPAGALLQYPVDGVLAVVVDQLSLLVPLSPAPPPRNPLRPDHPLTDAIAPHQTHSPAPPPHAPTFPPPLPYSITP